MAFVANAPYLPWVATAIKSCRDHSDAVVVHLLHDGSISAADGRAALADELHEIPLSRVESLPALDRFGRIVWLRFLLPELLPDVDRVLYLDADTLIVDSLQPLVDVSLGGLPLGAVANVLDPGMRSHVQSLGIDPKQFFNSGVLLMDLAMMRAEGLSDALLRVAADRADELRWPDQDALNIVFARRWHHLEPRWNAMNSLWDWAPLATDVFGADVVASATTDPAVVHFEGPTVCKPWHSLNHHPWREEYWRVLRTTPWADTKPEDTTLATRLIARLPKDQQLGAFLRLSRWRHRRRQGVTA